MKGCDLQDAMDRMSVPTRVDEALMRRVCGNYATGVAIVSTMSATDQPVALTVNSFSSVSLDPPLILWILRSTSPSRRDRLSVVSGKRLSVRLDLGGHRILKK